MTTEIVSQTSLNTVENTIESWIIAASVLPDVKDDDGNTLPKVRWQGYDLGRKRPYASVNVVSQLNPGQPDQSQVLIDDAGTDKYQTTLKELAKWNIQITFYSDSYDDEGLPVRTVARHYAQRLVNNWKTQPIANILDAQDITVAPLNENITGNILPNIDDDKYIQQASIEYRFSFINQTDLKDTDFFTTVTAPTEENGGIIYSGV